MDRIEARRVAALYDIHGNLPALEAALEAVELAAVESIVVGGDVVLGPMPGESLDRLLELGPRARFIRGNCDRLVVDAFDGRPLDGLPAPVREPVLWAADRIERRHRDVLAGLPTSLAARVEGLGEVLFCHATPRSDDEIFTALTPAERVRPMLDGVTQAVVVCGHTHMPFDRRVDRIRVLNAGSVGMPFGAPGAHWLLLGPDARPMRTYHDPGECRRRVQATGYPQAAAFLEPPGEREALRMFEPAMPRAQP